jgi:cytoskeletal protein CcmA (bactofilin family)
MFGKKEETQKNQSIQVLNSIAAGTIIEGNVRTEGDLRVDGKVIGNIICKGRLVSGPSSEILGDILCVNGNLEGMCRGNIQVNEVLKVAKSANIDGIISTKKNMTIHSIYKISKTISCVLNTKSKLTIII